MCIRQLQVKAIKNIVLFIVGFCIYITIEVCFRGYSFPLMGICGGVALILNDKINDCVSWDTDLILQGLFGAVLITTMEFVIGTLALKGFITPMWDYSNVLFNYKGIICMPFSAVWALLSIIGIFISDAINYYLFEEEQCPYYKIFGYVVLRFKERGCAKKNVGVN